MLTPQDIQKLKTTTMSGGVPSGKAMNDAQFQAWSKPSPAPSPKTSFMGSVLKTVASATPVGSAINSATDLAKMAGISLNPLTNIGKIGEAAKAGVAQVKTGFDQAKLGNDPLTATRGALNIAAGGINTVFSPLAPLFEPVGKVVNVVANKVSDIPAVQKFAMGKTGQNVATGAEMVNNASTILGAVAGGIKGKEVVPEGINSLKTTIKDIGDTGTGIKNTVSKAITPNSPEVSIVDSYNKAIKPSIAGKTAPGQLDKYNQNVVSAVKSISTNKDNLSFTSDIGETNTGKLPQTRGELSDAVVQTKQSIYKQYNDLSKQATGQGVQIPLEPVGTELNNVISNEALKISNPSAVDYAQKIQQRLQNPDGTYRTIDPTVTEQVITNYNASLKVFYRNPTYETASHAAIDAGVVNTLRGVMDEQINSATGANYQALKNQYGALSAIEKDVNKAAIAQAKQTGTNTMGLGKYVDVFSGGDIVSGLLSLNPALFAKGIAQSGISHFFQWFNSPDRAVGNMFKSVSSVLPPK